MSTNEAIETDSVRNPWARPTNDSSCHDGSLIRSMFWCPCGVSQISQMWDTPPLSIGKYQYHKCNLSWVVTLPILAMQFSDLQFEKRSLISVSPFCHTVWIAARSCLECAVPADGDISILHAIDNGRPVPLHCLCVHTDHFGQRVERHIADVIVLNRQEPAHHNTAI